MGGLCLGSGAHDPGLADQSTSLPTPLLSQNHQLWLFLSELLKKRNSFSRILKIAGCELRAHGAVSPENEPNREENKAVS